MVYKSTRERVECASNFLSHVLNRLMWCHGMVLRIVFLRFNTLDMSWYYWISSSLGFFFLKRKLSLTLSWNGLWGPILPLPICVQTLSSTQGALLRNGLVLLFYCHIRGCSPLFVEGTFILLCNKTFSA